VASCCGIYLSILQFSGRFKR